MKSEQSRIDLVTRPKSNTANRALDETVAFDKAIRETMEFLAEKSIVEDTLVIVTADHSHAFTMAGYPARGTYLGFETPAPKKLIHSEALWVTRNNPF